jgi:uncharacterized hydantoinase/oxoprolinase family protein
MLCCDRDELSLDEARDVARELSDRQVGQISSAIDRVTERMYGVCPAVIVSGSGDFLARRAVEQSQALRDPEIHSLRAALGNEHAVAACAFALARLALERVT